MRLFSTPPPRPRAGYTLAEVMLAVGVFLVGGGIAYPLLVGDVALYARNFSLNKSNNSLRQSLQHLKQDIDMAIEPPRLVGYRVSGAKGILTPLPDTTVSAPGILLWVSLGPAYDMQGSDSGGTGTVPVAGTITLNRRVNPTPSASDPYPNSPMPQVGDRLVIMSPGPYTAGMPETVTMDNTPIVKPGRLITSVNGVTSGPVPDNNAAQVSVTLDATNPLPTQIAGPQSAYVVREVAYVASTLNDAGGSPAECRLIRYASTADMTNGRVLIRDLDPTPLENDPVTNKPIQPFNYYPPPGGTVGGIRPLSPLAINLPVRALDYANVITTRQATESSEFNVYLRSSPQMGVKVRLD